MAMGAVFSKASATRLQLELHLAIFPYDPGGFHTGEQVVTGFAAKR